MCESLWPGRTVELARTVMHMEDGYPWLDSITVNEINRKISECFGAETMTRPFATFGNVQVLAIVSFGIDGLNLANMLFLRVALETLAGDPVITITIVPYPGIDESRFYPVLLPDEAAEKLVELADKLDQIPGLTPKRNSDGRPPPP